MSIHNFIPAIILVLLHTLTPAMTQAPRVTMCYVTSWSLRRCQEPFSLDSLDLSLCTHINFGFANINYVNNTLAVSDDGDIAAFARLSQMTSNTNIKTLLSVGGHGAGADAFRVVSDVSKRGAFINHTLAFLRQHGFQGLTVDWQYPTSFTRALYHSFVKALSVAFENEDRSSGQEKLLLTVTMSANHENIPFMYYMDELPSLVDYIQVMTYDYWGQWSSRLGHHSPLYAESFSRFFRGRYSVAITTDALLQAQVPRSKILLGLPAFARTASLLSPDMNRVGNEYLGHRDDTNNYMGSQGQPGPVTQQMGLLSYPEVCNYLNNSESNWTSVYNNISQVPHAFSSRYPYVWAGYDDAESFRNKALFAVQLHLAGVFVWSLDLDDFSGAHCNLGPYPLTRQVKAVFDANPPTSPIPTTRGPRTQAPVVTLTSSPTPTPAPTTIPTTTVPSTPQPFIQCVTECEEPGFYPHCFDCSQFVQCGYQNMFYVQQCSVSLEWDPVHRVCNFPSLITAERNCTSASAP